MKMVKTYMMNDRQLHYALVLAEERSFTRTANKLNIAQPSLSQYINNLEQSLGHKLFDRTVTPLRLTAAGELYIEMARKIVDLERQLDQRLSDIEDEPSGTLSIGASAHHSLYTLPQAIKLFVEKYPRYNIMVSEQPNDLRMQLLEKGELDLCLTLLPANKNKFDWTEVLTEELLLALPVDHPMNDSLTVLDEVKPGRNYPMVDLSELKDTPFIMVSENYNLYRMVNNLCRQSGLQPREIVKCESTEVCHTMAAAGIGAAILQSVCVNYEGFSQKLRYYSIIQDYPMRNLAVAYRKNQYISRAAMDFIKILKSL